MAAAKQLIGLSAHANIDQKILDETARRIAEDARAAELEGLGLWLACPR